MDKLSLSDDLRYSDFVRKDFDARDLDPRREHRLGERKISKPRTALSVRCSQCADSGSSYTLELCMLIYIWGTEMAKDINDLCVP